MTGGGAASAAAGAAAPSNNSLLGDIFGIGGSSSTTFYIPPKQEWLSATKGKGLEVLGTFSRYTIDNFWRLFCLLKIILENFYLSFGRK